jgi:hypothetical protein
MSKLNDMKITFPIKKAPTKDIREKTLMVDDGTKSFPTGDSTEPFNGVKGKVHGIGTINGKDLPWMNRK